MIPFLLKPNFLLPHQHQSLLSYFIDSENRFQNATTSNNDVKARNSKFLMDPSPFHLLIEGRVRETLSEVYAIMGIPEIDISHIEVQMTSHNDGEYYHLHNDDGSEHVVNRVLTYVYYLYDEPKPFDGGELKLHIDGGVGIPPTNNCCIFFPSKLMHEVLETRVPSRRFRDSRFTVNGWIWKK